MDPVSIIKTTAPMLEKLGRWWSTRNDEAFKRERDEMFRAWTAELAIAVKENVAQMEQLIGELEATRRIEVTTSSGEFWRVLDNYGYEAAREAIDERRKMLAWAAAGSLCSELTVAQLARIERTIRELDPNDVAVLRRLDQLSFNNLSMGNGAQTDGGAKIQADAIERHQLWTTTQPSGDILTASGCVLVQDYNFDFPIPNSPLRMPHVVPIVTVTNLGRWVLAVTSGLR